MTKEQDGTFADGVEAAAKVVRGTRPTPEQYCHDALYGYERAVHDIAAAIRALQPGAGREDGATVEQYNAAFDPADEAGGNAYRAGFEEGWIFAQSPDGSDYDDLKEQYGRAVDTEPSEAWDGYRDTFFAALPLAALPKLATPPQEGPTDE